MSANSGMIKGAGRAYISSIAMKSSLSKGVAANMTALPAASTAASTARRSKTVFTTGAISSRRSSSSYPTTIRITPAVGAVMKFMRLVTIPPICEPRMALPAPDTPSMIPAAMPRHALLDTRPASTSRAPVFCPSVIFRADRYTVYANMVWPISTVANTEVAPLPPIRAKSAYPSIPPSAELSRKGMKRSYGFTNRLVRKPNPRAMPNPT